MPARLLDAAGVRAEEPQLGDGVVGGLLIDTHGFVAAGELTRALAVAATRARRAVRRAEPRASHREPRRRRSSSTTDRGSLHGDAVVVAAGSWSGEIAIDGVTAHVPVRPVRGQLLSLAWIGTPLRRVTWSRRCYLVPWDDGTVLVGATVEEVGFDERATVAGVRDLLDAACDRGPARVGRGLSRRARRSAAGHDRRSADHRRVASGAESDVRDGPLSQRRAAGAADRAAGGRRDARES